VTGAIKERQMSGYDDVVGLQLSAVHRGDLVRRTEQAVGTNGENEFRSM
jgi:hypothetical protein